MKKLISIVSLLILLYSCSTESQEIDYGNENCHFCTMTITDDRFASQFVLTTGKAHKFCSIECMVRELNRAEDITAEDIDNYYVIDMTNPDVFFPASNATFLISEKIQSPMGANLAAFNDKSKAKEMQNKWDGVIYTWDKLLTKFN